MPIYAAIDLKSFYASAECVERGYDSSLALCFECKAHFMSIGYVVIAVYSTMPNRTCVERILCAPIDYGLKALIIIE